jgi:hypothetical protein
MATHNIPGLSITGESTRSEYFLSIFFPGPLPPPAFSAFRIPIFHNLLSLNTFGRVRIEGKRIYYLQDHRRGHGELARVGEDRGLGSS